MRREYIYRYATHNGLPKEERLTCVVSTEENPMSFEHEGKWLIWVSGANRLAEIPLPEDRSTDEFVIDNAPAGDWVGNDYYNLPLNAGVELFGENGFGEDAKVAYEKLFAERVAERKRIFLESTEKAVKLAKEREAQLVVLVEAMKAARTGTAAQRSQALINYQLWQLGEYTPKTEETKKG